MALGVECPKGHSYVASDIYVNWPDGLPKCPTCRRLMVVDEQNRQLRDAIEKFNQSVDATKQALEDFVKVCEEKNLIPEKLIDTKSWVKKE
jgi:hypothetical protein